VTNIREKIAWALAGTLGLLVAAALSGVIDAGPLDPPGAPAPTGKTLEQIPGSWSRALPANDGAPGPSPPAGCNSTRFQCVLGDAAVLDRETGLVWAQDAGAFVAADWTADTSRCLTSQVAGRRGWRMPTFEELQSLVDLSVGSPTLPPGHPFLNVKTDDAYWTQTSLSSTAAWAYDFDNGVLTEPKTNTNYVWCVRGGQEYDGM